MARRYDVALDSLWTQVRNFRLAGRLPTAPAAAPGDPRRVVPFCTLGAHELEASGELGFGPEYVEVLGEADEPSLHIPLVSVHTDRWRALNQRLYAIVLDLVGNVGGEFVDGTWNLAVQDDFVVRLRAIDDPEHGQIGVLFFAHILELTHEQAEEPAFEGHVQRANANLPLGELVVSSLADLVPLDTDALALAYTLFLPWGALARERDPQERLRRAVTLAHHVRELVACFGLSDALVNALRPVQGSATADTEPAAPVDVAPVASDLADLPRRLSALNARYINLGGDALRETLLRYLQALGCAVSGDATGTIRLQHRGVTVDLTLRGAPVACVTIAASVADDIEPDDALFRHLLPFSQTVVVGSLALWARPEHEGRFDLIFGDTVLAGELDLDELALACANVLLTGLTLRETLNARVGLLVPEPSQDAASLAPLFTYLESRKRRAHDLPTHATGAASELQRRLDAFMARLGLSPRLSRGHNTLFKHHGVPVTLALREDGPDTFITLRATVAERLEAQGSLLRWLLTSAPVAEIGGYRILENGVLVYEDTILGNSVDLNEFAFTLHTVADAALGAQQHLLGLAPDDPLRLQEQHLPTTPPPPNAEAFKELYAQSADPIERCKALQALAILGASCRDAALPGLLDPHPVAADFAATALIASNHELRHQPDTLRALCAQLHEVLTDLRLADATRARALRVLAGIADLPDLAPGQPLALAAEEALADLVQNPRESLALRLHAAQVLPVIGQGRALQTLLDLLKQPRSPLAATAVTALDAFAELSEQDAALVRQHLLAWLAASPPLDADTTAVLINLQINPLEATAEPAAAPDEAVVATPDARLLAALAREAPEGDASRRLHELLQSNLGAVRRKALDAILTQRLEHLTPALASALRVEPDPSLKRRLLLALAELRARGFLAFQAIEPCVNDDHLRAAALRALRRLHRG